MTFSKREVITALAFLFGVFLLASANERRLQGDLSLARHDASTARELSRAADNRAGLLSERADAAERRADSIAHLPARVRYLTAKAAAPDTCKVVVQAADAALAQADGVTVALHEAVDNTKVALSAVRGSQRQLEAATSNLERASKPSLLRALVPRVGFGVGAGVNPVGKPDVVAGVTLGWSL